MSAVASFQVTFVSVYPSGLAIQVEYEGKEYSIPNSAIDADSEIWKGCDRGETGNLIVNRDLAISKGLIDPPSRSLGGGIPLKRHKLPDPPDLLPERRLGAISARWDASSAHEYGWAADGEEVYLGDQSIGLFHHEEDAAFAAHAPDDIRALLDENLLLRRWMKKALKTQERRKQKKRKAWT